MEVFPFSDKAEHYSVTSKGGPCDTRNKGSPSHVSLRHRNVDASRGYDSADAQPAIRIAPKIIVSNGICNGNNGAPAASENIDNVSSFDSVAFLLPLA